jgi:selenide,water dikinase
VTGFGLIGHLAEMTSASQVEVELSLPKLPVLEGARETAAADFLSSLHPENVRLGRAIRNPQEGESLPIYPLLFDPQTSGGLLAGVPEDRAEECQAKLRERGYESATLIGAVRGPTHDAASIVLRS